MIDNYHNLKPKLTFHLTCPATTLTGFHFLVTALVGAVSNAAGLSASKHVPLWELLWFSVLANMSITGMNFSLMLNSVGFYQVCHLLVVPLFFFIYKFALSSSLLCQVSKSFPYILCCLGLS